MGSTPVILFVAVMFKCLIAQNGVLTTFQQIQDCYPFKMYIKGSKTCICTENGTWPSTECLDFSKNLISFASPERQACELNGYVVKDCNVCRCGDNGEVDLDRCTKNDCENHSKVTNLRKFMLGNNVLSTCKAKNWYSMAPCQFCYCIRDNKLVCNTGNLYLKTLRLGLYNLTMCGTEFIKEAIGLAPEVMKNADFVRYNAEDHTPATAQDNAVHVDVEKVQMTTKIPVYKPKPSLSPSRPKSKPTYQNLAIDDKVSEEAQQIYEYVSDSRSDNDKQSLTEGKKSSSFTPFNRFTAIPMENSNEIEAAEKYYEENSDNGSEESGEKQLTLAPLINNNSKANAPPKKTKSSIENMLSSLSQSIKINFPGVLGSAFNIRKTQIIANPGTNCEPGTEFPVACNTCYCMKNGKLLCTENKCT